MCDTLVALGNATTDGSVILAKNSDREPNEAHVLVRYPHAHHDAGSEVECTYIAIPQVEETYEVLLCKPFWIWGCEMGANEKGVAIGNEAVFTKEPYAKTGLLGMDLMRLALERADTADKALQIITDLLAEHGQGGSCGYRRKGLRYHNSFIVADVSSAWVLETAGEHWAAERVRDVRTISNRLTIGHDYDLASPRLVDHAIERGWCNSRDDFHFARCYSDFVYTHFSRSRARQKRSTHLVKECLGEITVATMMAALRDHGEAPHIRRFEPHRGCSGALCVHAASGPIRFGQTTGSLVSHLAGEGQTHWVTGTSAPCTSVFKPLYLNNAPLPDIGPAPEGVYDDRALWWRHERLHRSVLRDYSPRLGAFREDADALEEEFLAEERALSAGPSHLEPLELAKAQAQLSQQCFHRASEALQEWTARAKSVRPTRQLPWLYRSFWRKQERQAGVPGGGF